MPARSVCLVTLSLSEAGPRRFGRQVSVTDIYHTIPAAKHLCCCLLSAVWAQCCFVCPDAPPQATHAPFQRAPRFPR